MSQIKTAVSLYSLQDSYATGRLDLRDALDFVASTGATGVELVSDQMIKGTPFPDDETVSAWRSALDTSGLVPVCNDVTMALEVHAGMSFHGALTSAWIEMMRKAQSERLGLVIDLGIFCHRHPRVSTDYFRTIGLTPAVADKIDEIFAANGDTYRVFTGGAVGGMTFPPELTALFRGPVDGEYSIDYPSIMTRLDRLGYDGYIASEYEGNRFTTVNQPVNDLGQVRGHQAMLSAHLDDGR
jgi:sugar phosphate isomerase/epimerase